MGFGGVGWSTPSNMAKTGHLYSYDNAQNASFPAQVTATKFIGDASSANGVTPEWSGSLAYGNTDWICAWKSDGKKIKAMSKSVFATASHTHNYNDLSNKPTIPTLEYVTEAEMKAMFTVK